VAHPKGTAFRGRRPVLLAIALLVAVVGFGTWAVLRPNATDAQQPRLFSAATIASTGSEVDAQTATAHRLMAQWWRGHGTRADDRGFTRWIETVLPAPPKPSARQREIATLVTLAHHRDTTGITTATWLGDHGRDDIWKQYADSNSGTLHGGPSQSDLDHLLDWTKQTTDSLKAHYHQPSPYVVNPQLRPDKASTQTSDGSCTCSYPSSHAASTAAAVTYLRYFAPQQNSFYRHMQAEVDYSRLYMAGHVNSDLTAGTLLGDMLGEYFLVTRDHAPTT
jgi:hypothetical protein